jgi:phosphoserine/homoserine phosphotransferase
MHLACLDVEGVLVPEIWQNVALRTGVEELQLTTRDVPDYHELMQRRLGILDEHGISTALHCEGKPGSAGLLRLR